MTHHKPPKIWKMIALTWVIIYPLLNILFFLLGPHIAEWHNLLKTLLMTAILVPAMVMIMGFLQKRLFHWLRQ